MMTTRQPEGLYLPSWGLTSKWGFNDGDVPDDWFEWVLDNHPETSYSELLDTWQTVLMKLVEYILIPRIGLNIELIDWGKPINGYHSGHNPARIGKLNGEYVDYQDIDLPECSVVVPWAVVWNYHIRVARGEGI